MTKVYVVTAGSYSDKEVVGVFDNKDTAQQFIDKFECNDVEEYELNARVKQVSSRLTLCYVQMDYYGNAATVRTEYDETWEGVDFVNMYGGTLTTYCYATSPEHAVKIVNERRVFLIAENIFMPHSGENIRYSFKSGEPKP